MPTPIVFEDVAPVVPVRDLQVALVRYRQLGFEVRAYGHGTGYGYARRGAASIHLSEWDEHDPKRTSTQRCDEALGSACLQVRPDKFGRRRSDP